MRRNYFRRQAGKGLHPLGYPENLPGKIGKGGGKSVPTKERIATAMVIVLHSKRVKRATMRYAVKLAQLAATGW